MTRAIVLAVVSLVAATLYASGGPSSAPKARAPARIIVDGGPGWREGARVNVRVDGASPPVSTHKSFVTISVDDGKQKSRRVASLVPSAQYVVRGNPCAQWTLAASGDGAVGAATAGSERRTTLRVDASALPAAWFPLAVTLGEGEEPTTTLAVAGTTEPQDIIESAMCMGAGVRVRVESRSLQKRKVLFDVVVIAHEGAASTVRVEGPDRFTLAVDP